MSKGEVKPSRQDRLKPLEFIVLSAIIAVFIGLVVIFSSRDLQLGLVFFGVSFIVSLVVIAMLSLAVRPDEAEKIEMHDQDEGH